MTPDPESVAPERSDLRFLPGSFDRLVYPGMNLSDAPVGIGSKSPFALSMQRKSKEAGKC